MRVRNTPVSPGRRLVPHASLRLSSGNVAAPGFTPQEFRLSANFPLEHERAPCSGAPDVASADGDEAFDSSRSGGATVKAVGDFPGPELLSLQGDWLYHRALRF